MTVTANPGQGKVYGDPDPALTYAVANGAGTTGAAIVAGDSLTGELARAPGETVAGGPYAVNQGTLNANVPSNYVITFVGNTFAITPAALTVVADPQSKVYGVADPALTYAASGFKLGDTPASALSGTLTRAPGETVAGSPYAITQGTLAANANYTMTFTGSTLTITPAGLVITANDAGRAYGDPNPAFTATFTGLANGDTPASIAGLTLSTPATVASNAGAYIITPLGAANPNYTITFANGTLTITPAPLTVRADDASRYFGEANPLFTATFSGFKLGQTAADLAGTLAISTPAGPPSPPGLYAITPAGVSSINYAVTFVNGTLVVATSAPAEAESPLDTAMNRAVSPRFPAGAGAGACPPDTDGSRVVEIARGLCLEQRAR